MLLVPMAHFVERPHWRVVLRRWPLLLCMGLTGSLLYKFTLYEALQFTSATSAAFVQALNPAVLVLFAMIFLRERLHGKQTTGLVVSLIGVLVLLSKGDWNVLLAADYNRGDLLMVAALISLLLGTPITLAQLLGDLMILVGVYFTPRVQNRPILNEEIRS
ncbi:DMT family transporter [Tumebacillus flagellatus]|uniref:EamA domain-containing protein n=1 Tax=Tumebacillus flagellatus TaxID=1157490 RepID=A0A074LP78_9BACL|nr:DMT family transporter [Tumebacillus flagellatus]KEO82310.1 hypothetical protein EL26_16140 [Tumebacillus flagellatus]